MTISADAGNGNDITFAIDGDGDGSIEAGNNEVIGTITGTGSTTFTPSNNGVSSTATGDFNIYAVEEGNSDGNQDTAPTTSDTSTTLTIDGSSPQFTAGGSNSVNQDEGTTSDTLDVEAGDDSTSNPDTDVTYTLSGTDGDEFDITSSGGVISPTNALDHESPSDSNTDNAYELTVTAEDDAGNTNTQDITVTINDVAENPTFNSGDTTSVSEDATSTDSVLDVNADVGGTDDQEVTYSITSGNTDSAYAIDSTSGQITVNDGSQIDYEQSTSNSITITAKETGTSATNTQSVTVTINDVDESPTFTTTSLGSVSEDATNGDNVDNVDANVGGDADEGVSYALNNGGSAFDIDNSGQITVGDASQIDHESSQSISVTVEASEGSATNTKDFTIDVTDVNEAPTGEDNTVTIDEDNDKVFSKTEFGFSDEDSDDSSLQSVKISSLPNNGELYVDSDTDGTVDDSEGISSTGTTVSATEISNGEFKFKPATDENGDAYATFEFKVGDGSLYADTASTMTISVDAVNDAPTLDSSTYNLNSIDEDATSNSGTTVSNILADGSTTDVDGDTLGVAVTGVNNKNGDWQYKISDTWNDFSSVSDSSALLLDDSDSIRFVPDDDYDGSDTGSVTIRAWDQTTGTSGNTGVDTSSNGGTNAFSSGTETTAVTVQDAPEVNSIERASGETNPTNADSVDFTVTFSESVSGVAADDFTTTGSASGDANTVSRSSGSTIDVTVSSVSGDGDLGLKLNDDDDGITANSVPLGGEGTSGTADGSYTSEETFTIDNTPPEVNEEASISTSSENGIVNKDDSFTVSVNASDVTSEIQDGGVTVDLSGLDKGSSNELTQYDSTDVYNKTFTLSSNDHEIDSFAPTVTITDTASNDQTSTPSGVTVDSKVPSVTTGNTDITLTTDSNSNSVANPGDTVEVTWDSDADGVSDVGTVEVDFSNFGGESTVTATDPNSDGTYNASYTVQEGSTDNSVTGTVTVTDDAGNTGSADTGTQAVDNKVPSQPRDLTATPVAGGDIQLDWNAPEEDSGDSLQYTVQVNNSEGNWKDVSGKTDLSSTSTTVGTSSDGSYTYRVKVSDDSSNTATSDTVTATSDSSSPTVQSAAYRDSNNDGTVDKVDVEFSEPVSYSPSTPDSDWSYSNSLPGFSIDGKSAVEGSTVTLEVIVDEGVTGAVGTEPSIDISATSTVTDDVGNAASADGEVTMADEASPVVDYSEGTNMVSFPSTVGSYSLDNLVSESSNVDAVWRYKDGNWESYKPGKQNNDFTNVTGGQGYILEASGSGEIVADVDQEKSEFQPSGVSLDKSRWNLVGHYEEVPQSVNSVSGLSNTGDEDEQVASLNPFTQVSTVMPGDAYWVETATDELYAPVAQ